MLRCPQVMENKIVVHRGILTNLIKSSESEFRKHANSREVEYFTPPTIKERFQCFGEGVEFGMRLISTSPVIEVTQNENDFTFQTESGSSYHLNFLSVVNE